MVRESPFVYKEHCGSLLVLNDGLMKGGVTSASVHSIDVGPPLDEPGREGVLVL